MVTKLFFIFFIIYLTLWQVNATSEEQHNLPKQWTAKRRRSKANHRLTDPSSSSIAGTSNQHAQPIDNLNSAQMETMNLEQDEPDDILAQYLLHFADHVFDQYNEFQEPRNSDVALQDEDLRNHKFMRTEKYTNCNPCYHKYASREEAIKNRTVIRSICRECRKPMCRYCFKERHHLECLPTVYTDKPDIVPDQECQYCHKNLGNNEDALVKHTNTCKEIHKHTDELYGCYACTYANYNKDTIRNHIRTHTGYKPYKCNQCHYKTKSRSSLASHMKSDKHLY